MWEMATDPTNVTRWMHKFGFFNRGVQWDTPMSKCAGEGKNWTQLMARVPHRKENVTFSLLASIRHATEKRTGKKRAKGFVIFCVGLFSACKSTCIQSQRIFFELHLRGFLLVVVLVLVVQVRDQFVSKS